MFFSIRKKESLSVKAAIISLGQLANTLSHLAAAVVLSYYLTKTDYGTYRQVWLVYNSITPILVLGLPMSINYFFPKMDGADQKKLNVQTILMLSFLGFLFSILLFFSAPLIGKFFNNFQLVEPLRLFSFIPLLTFPTLYYQNLFVCLNKATLVAKLSLFKAFGYLFSIFMPVFLGYSINQVFIILNIFSFIQLLVVLILITQPFKEYRIKWDFSLISGQLTYSVPIGLTAFVGIFNKQLDKLFISSFFSVSEFATYINGAFEIPVIGIITGSVTAVLMPEFVKLFGEGNKEELIRLWHASIRKVSLIICPILVFLMVFAPEFISVLFSHKYTDSSTIFRIYLMALPIRITNFGMVLLAFGLPSLVFKYAFYTLILNVIFNFLLFKLIGFTGPAVASIIVMYFMAFIQMIKILEKLNVSFKKIFPWKNLARIFGVSALSTVGLLPLYYFRHFSNPLIPFLIGGLLFTGLYMILGLKTKIIQKSDLLIPEN